MRSNCNYAAIGLLSIVEYILKGFFFFAPQHPSTFGTGVYTLSNDGKILIPY